MARNKRTNAEEESRKKADRRFINPQDKRIQQKDLEKALNNLRDLQM